MRDTREQTACRREVDEGDRRSDLVQVTVLTTAPKQFSTTESFLQLNPGKTGTSASVPKTGSTKPPSEQHDRKLGRQTSGDNSWMDGISYGIWTPDQVIDMIKNSPKDTFILDVRAVSDAELATWPGRSTTNRLQTPSVVVSSRAPSGGRPCPTPAWSATTFLETRFTTSESSRTTSGHASSLPNTSLSTVTQVLHDRPP